MIAFTFSLALFYFLFLVGRATLLVSKSNLELKIQQFLSPAVGLAVTILLIFTVSRTGNSMRDGAIPIFIAELIFALLVLKKMGGIHRLQLNDTIYCLMPFGVLTSAWPILKYGFNWVSYVNDDMNNYVLAARRFYESGFFTLPNLQELNSGSNYSLAYYFFHVEQNIRPGSELFLAFTSRFIKGDTMAAFMPSILALQMVLLSSTLALSVISTKSTRKSLIFTGLFSLVLPLFSLGFLYQLIGQVGGLGIGMAAIVYWKSELEGKVFRTLPAVIFSLIVASQMIWYPEYLPFIVVGIFLSSLINGTIASRSQVIFYISILMTLALVLQSYLFKSIIFMFDQIRSTNQSSIVFNGVNEQLFPYFLKPHGISSLFGFSPLNVWFSPKLETLTIAFSLLLILVIVYTSSKRGIRKNIYLHLLGTQSLILVYFIYSQTGFAAFKLSMYMQPLLAIALAHVFIEALRIIRNRKKFFLGIGILSNIGVWFGVISLMAATNIYYSNASTGNRFGGFAEIPFASKSKILENLDSARKNINQPNPIIISNALNLSQAKIEAYGFQGTPIIFPAFRFFSNFYIPESPPISNISTTSVELGKRFENNSFEQIDFRQTNRAEPVYFLLARNPFDIINYSQYLPKDSYWNYSVSTDIHNLLSFVNSKDGPAYYGTPQRARVAIFQTEKDPMRPGSFMQSLGNKLLFQVFNADSQSRFVIRISASLLPQQDRILPPVSLIGAKDNNFSITGRGSARVFIANPSPHVINGLKYFQINIMRKSRPFPQTHSHFSDLYNSEIKQDGRSITVFGQDISYIQNSEYSEYSQKTISIFPKDLENNQLFYSGIYEDGWFSENSYAILNASSRDDLLVKGTVPLIGTDAGFITSGQLLIDGKVIATKELGVGDFDFTIRNKDLPKELSGNHRVEVKFSKLQRLPGADGRPVSAKIIFMGFTSSK